MHTPSPALNATTKEHTVPTLVHCKIVADSGVYTDDQESYQREILFTEWHPDDPRWMGRVTVKVDRLPHRSYARAYVWQDSKWTPMGSLPPDQWWSSMPGFARANSPAANVKSYNLADEVADLLHALAAADAI